MNKMTAAFAGAAIGAATMYMLDPSRGRRRRARLREAAVHTSRSAKAVAAMTARDVEHRVGGLAARALDRLID